MSFSGKSDGSEQELEMQSLLKGGAVNGAYRFLLEATEDGGTDDEGEGLGYKELGKVEDSDDVDSSACSLSSGTNYDEELVYRAAFRLIRGESSKPGRTKHLRTDKRQESVLLARAMKGDYDDLLDYLYPVCEYLSRRLVDNTSKAYFSVQEVQSVVYDKLSEQDGAFMKEFNPDKSSIKTWVSRCVIQDLSRLKKQIDKERALIVSIDAPVSPGNTRISFADVIPDDYQPPYEKNEIEVEQLIKSMDNELEQKVVKAVWLNNSTLKSVSQELGLSLSKVRRVRMAALLSLRRIVRKLGLID